MVPDGGLAQIVRGQVVDSLTNAPLAKATVSLLQRDSGIIDQTTADDEGLFLLRAAEAGAYRVAVEFPLYRFSTFPEFSLAAEAVASFQLLVARDRDAESLVRRNLCPESGNGPIVVGTLRNSETGEAAGRATIRYHMPAVPGNLTSHVEYDVEGTLETDSAGVYVLCDVPAYAPVSLSAHTNDRRSEHASLMFYDEGVVDGAFRQTLSTSIYRRDFFLVPETSWHGQVSAVVTDTLGLPLSGANVRVLGSAVATQTDAAGRFQLNGMSDGWVRLEVRHLGYRPLQVEAQLIGGSTSGIFQDHIVLEQLPVRLADIIVEARPGERRLVEEGFFDREQWAQGSVLAMREYERIHGQPSKLSEMLRSTRGVRITPQGTIAVARCNGPMAVFINNMYLPPLLAPESIDYYVPIDDVIGVEVHTRIGIPPRFRRQRNQCAAVVIWTR
jgi:hypothetical protein